MRGYKQLTLVSSEDDSAHSDVTKQGELRLVRTVVRQLSREDGTSITCPLWTVLTHRLLPCCPPSSSSAPGG